MLLRNEAGVPAESILCTPPGKRYGEVWRGPGGRPSSMMNQGNPRYEITQVLIYIPHFHSYCV